MDRGYGHDVVESSSPPVPQDEAATQRAVLEAPPGAEVVHFSCHGGMDWGDPHAHWADRLDFDHPYWWNGFTFTGG